MVESNQAVYLRSGKRFAWLHVRCYSAGHASGSRRRCQGSSNWLCVYESLQWVCASLRWHHVWALQSGPERLHCALRHLLPRALAPKMLPLYTRC